MCLDQINIYWVWVSMWPNLIPTWPANTPTTKATTFTSLAGNRWDWHRRQNIWFRIKEQPQQIQIKWLIRGRLNGDTGFTHKQVLVWFEKEYEVMPKTELKKVLRQGPRTPITHPNQERKQGSPSWCWIPYWYRSITMLVCGMVWDNKVYQVPMWCKTVC